MRSSIALPVAGVEVGHTTLISGSGMLAATKKYGRLP